MDPLSILNLMLSAFIAFAFGTLSAWITYRYQRNRDDRLWEHEKAKLRDEINEELRKHRELIVRSEILPTIWRNLLDTLGTFGFITAMIRRYPDLSHMNDEALAEFLKDSRLSNIHKEQLMEAPDKNEFYQRTIFWYELIDAQQKFNEFHNHLLYNKIYLNTKLFEKLSEIDKSLSHLLSQAELAHRHPSVYTEKIYESTTEFNKKAEVLVSEIEREIQQNLHS